MQHAVQCLAFNIKNKVYNHKKINVLYIHLTYQVWSISTVLINSTQLTQLNLK